MAEENAEGAAQDEEGGCPEPIKCPECPPGLPAWMATFSDLVTLLLTFFVLLLSMAKTDVAKYEAALGSIRNAFGGNVLKQGEVLQKGKSPDNSPTMMESAEPVKPFPIDFLTMEGMLDKHEINRESDEDLKSMKEDLNEFKLSDSAEIYEVSEGIKVKIRDQIMFKKGSLKIVSGEVSVDVYQRIVKLLKNKNWSIFVQGHASRGEESRDKKKDAFSLSSARAAAVTRSLIRRGVRAEKITTVFYGDTRPFKGPGVEPEEAEKLSRRVEFMIRKKDLGSKGHKVDSN